MYKIKFHKLLKKCIKTFVDLKKKRKELKLDGRRGLVGPLEIPNLGFWWFPALYGVVVLTHLEEGDAHVSFLFLPMRKAANVRDGWIKYEEQMMPRGNYKEKGRIT